MLHTFTAYKINLDGSLSHRENLGHSELDDFMERVHGKFANVKVVRDDGKTVNYTDNGVSWDKF